MLASEITHKQWEKKRGEVGFNAVFSNVNFINTYSHSFSSTPAFFQVVDVDKPCLLLAGFSKGRTLSFPTYYFFTPIWVNSDLSPILRNRAVETLLVFLKQRYFTINLRLPLGFKDIRPFIWQGFTSTLKFTYVKSLSELTYHENIKRILKKGNSDYSVKVIPWTTEIEQFLPAELIHIQFRKSKVPSIVSSLKELCNLDLMVVFAGYYKDKLVACDLVLKDMNELKAYMFFISKSYGHYKSGFPAMMYDYVFKYFQEKGVNEVDMFGANIPEIALYKSKFTPELVDFFEVRYSFKRNIVEKNFKRVKSLIRRILHL